MAGRLTGARENVCTAPRQRNRPHKKRTAVSTPRPTAPAVASTATIRLVWAARKISVLAIRRAYHRSENPAGGKLRHEGQVNDARTATHEGRARNTPVNKPTPARRQSVRRT